MTTPTVPRPRAGSPAPLDLDEVRASLSGTGRMLPAAAYADEGVLEWERRVIFAGAWTCVGRCPDLATPRTRRAVRIGDDSVLLARGGDGVLRGFFNVCTHRGHELLPCGESASGRFITCPYHSWVFDLDGSLHKVPHEHREALEGEAGGGLGLAGAEVAEWQGFVLVNLDGAAPPLARYTAGLDDLLRPYELDRLVVAASHTYELAANWKLAVENYQECYHCSTIHPELCRVSPPDSGRNYLPDALWLGGSMELAPGATTMSLDGRSGSAPMRAVHGRQRREVHYVQLFPNLLISAHPDYVMTHVLEPLSAGRTRVTCEWLFPPETAAREDFDPAYAVDFWDLTNRQDWAACESVQRGLTSRGYRPGPLSPTNEDATFQAIAVVARAYLDGRLPASIAAALPESR
jgi:Rieske 2Fe-2S family protein